MRYSQYLAQTNVRHKTVSYNLLTPKPVEGDPDSLKPKKIEMTLKSAGNLLGPYSYVRIMDQIKAVVPLAVYLILFQVLVLRQPIDQAVSLCIGAGSCHGRTSCFYGRSQHWTHAFWEDYWR